MKKCFLVIAMIATLSLVGCKEDYKAKGEQMAKHLDELCEKQDSAAVLAYEDSIRIAEEEIRATGDTAAIADFQEALKESRERNTPYITALKVKNGKNQKEALEEVVGAALNGDVNIRTVTESIDKVLEQKQEDEK